MMHPNKPDEEKFILPDNIFLVPLVGQYTYAGYLSGFSDPEYMDMLPLVPIMADHEIRETYLSFEVKGDSMDNESSESLLEGDILICRQVNQDLWKDKLYIHKWDFVIVHKADGVLVKRITEHDIYNCEVKIHSLNDIYPDKTISLNDVAQLFSVVQVIRNRKR
jgi:SOS-response transcriptional repressor LexA